MAADQLGPSGQLAVIYPHDGPSRFLSTVNMVATVKEEILRKRSCFVWTLGDSLVLLADSLTFTTMDCPIKPARRIWLKTWESVTQCIVVRSALVATPLRLYGPALVMPSESNSEYHLSG